MPAGMKSIQHAGGHFRLADRSSASLPHLATRDMGHPQFLGPKKRKQIFLVRMFFIFLGGPKAHELSGRDDKVVKQSTSAWPEDRPQVSPLRFAPVETTKLLSSRLQPGRKIDRRSLHCASLRSRRQSC